jgi:hypothetical protein
MTPTEQEIKDYVESESGKSPKHLLSPYDYFRAGAAWSQANAVCPHIVTNGTTSHCELAEGRGAQEWQDLESAPKDDGTTVILLGSIEWNRQQPVIGQIEGGYVYPRGISVNWFTHWMPSPALPQPPGAQR